MRIEAKIIKSTGSWYVVQLATGERIDARLRGKFKLENKKISNPIAVGDRVVIVEDKGQAGSWVISEILPRTNYIIRKSPKKKGHGHMLAANIDLAVIIATVAQPRTSTGFIDRFLVTAESYRIPAMIIFNKRDLLNENELAEVNYMMEMYASLGYPNHLISAQEPKDLEHIKSLLLDKLTLLSGHSGVGKSTIINGVIPAANQTTAEVSTFANKGVHTTTFAEIFELATNSYLIDTPGIKELGLLEIENAELGHFFPEMRDMLGQCRFHNCMHIQEPGCAVIAGVENGDIWPSRYYSYLSMLEGDDNRR